jgi:SCY1-like protein 1
VQVVHGSLHAGSVFVTQAGEWKLFGFEQMTSTQKSEPTTSSSSRNHWPALTPYSPPEIKQNNSMYGDPNPAQDMWGLGCIIWEIFNGQLNQPNDLARIGKIPNKLTPTYMELVAANPKKRPNPKEKVQLLSNGPGAYFKNDIIDVMLFLEQVQIKDDQDKTRFFTSLPGKLDNIPKDICVHKILPDCIKAFDFSNAGALILAPVFKIGKNLTTEEYQDKIIPCIVKLFSSSDRNARFKLLTQIEHFVEHLNNKVVNNDVFPQVRKRKRFQFVQTTV